jgi:hypothetical protein
MVDFASEIYEDTSKLGRIYSLIGLIVGIIIAIILFICAFNFQQTPDNMSTIATILSASCTNIINNNKTEYSCVLKLKYTVNNKEYTNFITTQSNIYYNQNANIDITYEKDDPNKIYIKSLDNTSMSLISCCIGIVIILGAGVNYYLTNNSKFYAAGTGVASTINLFRK